MLSNLQSPRSRSTGVNAISNGVVLSIRARDCVVDDLPLGPTRAVLVTNWTEWVNPDVMRHAPPPYSVIGDSIKRCLNFSFNVI